MIVMMVTTGSDRPTAKQHSHGGRDSNHNKTESSCTRHHMIPAIIPMITKPHSSYGSAIDNLNFNTPRNPGEGILGTIENLQDMAFPGIRVEFCHLVVSLRELRNSPNLNGFVSQLPPRVGGCRS